MEDRIKLTQDQLEKLRQVTPLLGAYVKVDMSKSPKYYRKALKEGRRYFYTTLVGINNFTTCGNNNRDDNGAEFKCDPGHHGPGVWGDVGLDNIVAVEYPENEHGVYTASDSEKGTYAIGHRQTWSFTVTPEDNLKGFVDACISSGKCVEPEAWGLELNQGQKLKIERKLESLDDETARTHIHKILKR